MDFQELQFLRPCMSVPLSAPISFHRYLVTCRGTKACPIRALAKQIIIQKRASFYNYKVDHKVTRTVLWEQKYGGCHQVSGSYRLGISPVPGSCGVARGNQPNHQVFYRFPGVALLAVLGEKILTRLLVVAPSATNCRWTMYGLEMSRLLPFARKVFAAVLNGTSKSAIVHPLPSQLVSGPLAFSSLEHGEMRRIVQLCGVVLPWFDIHILCRRNMSPQSWSSDKATTEGTRPTGQRRRIVEAVHRCVVGSLTHLARNARMHFRRAGP